MSGEIKRSVRRRRPKSDKPVKTAIEERIAVGLPHLASEEGRALVEIVRRMIEAYEPERICRFGMQLDPARATETREWMLKAALNLRAGELELTTQPALTADTVFRFARPHVVCYRRV